MLNNAPLLSTAAPAPLPSPAPAARRARGAALATAYLFAAGPAAAADTWTAVQPGVDLLRRTATGPQLIHAARIDTSRPNIALRASANVRGAERGVNTQTFARSVGALVAINTDWSDGVTPVGLAMSGGLRWHDHIPDSRLGGHWGYVGCPLNKRCTLDREQPTDVAWWFTAPERAPYRFHEAVGANGILMIQGGVARSGCFDSSRNPRSALCLEADGSTMWMIAVDGRRSSAIGMTCDEVRALMLDLGCTDGVMLDGGGSTTLVVDDRVVNTPSDGSLRTVSNHLGVLYHGAADPECRVENGRWCEGSRLRTCQGGQPTADGDCAAYGATCQEDGDFAFCVDLRCPGGDGLGAACIDATRIASCSDGAYGEGDCAAFGLSCGEDALGAACQDPRCEAGPHSAFCTAGGQLGACAEGVYSASDCATGSACGDSSAGAVCVDDRCPAADGGACAGAIWQSCAAGVYAEADCAAEGLVCEAASGGCAEPPSGDGGGAADGGTRGDGDAADGAGSGDAAGGSGGAGEDAGADEAEGEGEGLDPAGLRIKEPGCSTSPALPLGMGLLSAIFALSLRRRPSPTAS